MTITPMEKKVLVALFKSSKGNGHDFGLVQECRGAVEHPRQLAGVMSSLAQKGIVIVHGDVTTDSGTWTQTTWAVDVEAVEALIK
jgi:transcription initiation factor IIE alpha subunit